MVNRGRVLFFCVAGMIATLIIVYVFGVLVPIGEESRKNKANSEASLWAQAKGLRVVEKSIVSPPSQYTQYLVTFSKGDARYTFRVANKAVWTSISEGAVMDVDYNTGDLTLGSLRVSE
jgi:hypothetical protein